MAVALPRSFNLVATLLGAMLAECTWVYLDPSYPGAQRRTWLAALQRTWLAALQACRSRRMRAAGACMHA